ncbi:hypothetical protein LTR53_014296 [Teratosphaeriaceae sp. CCFEE 6253]|nr:hypothetical protein LTR53_014296 [Teratosphaeriaceae sp. CCFEE 6253]
MQLADLEWLAALAYPVGILVSVLLAKKTSTVAPASITELKQQILANAALLHPNIDRTDGATLAIAVLSIQAPDVPTQSTRPAKPRAFRAALTLTLTSESGTDSDGESDDGSDASWRPTRIIAQGSAGGNLGEALESLLGVLASGLEERLGLPERGRARARERKLM